MLACIILWASSKTLIKCNGTIDFRKCLRQSIYYAYLFAHSQASIFEGFVDLTLQGIFLLKYGSFTVGNGRSSLLLKSVMENLSSPRSIKKPMSDAPVLL